MFNACLLNNPESLDPQYSSDASSATVISNLYSGLLKSDSTGTIICDGAESYTVSDDGLVYTFKLRQDVYWFFDKNDNDKADDDEYFNVTAKDYVFAFNRLLSPVTQSPHSEKFLCIKGAQNQLSGSTSQLSGVTSADDYTLTITLEHPNADFPMLLTTNAAKPCNEEFFLSTKGRYGLDDNSVMSNGAFFIRQWFYDPYGSNNILYMKRNAVNSENNTVHPSYLSFSIEKSQSDIVSSFKKGKTDCFSSMSFDGSYNKNKHYYNAEKTITLGLIFNPENEIYSNQNLRKAIAYSIDKEAVKKEINSDISVAYGIIPSGINLLGQSYRELSDHSAFSCYNKDEAVRFFERAKKELAIESLSSEKILVSTSSLNSKYLHILSQQWQELFGYYIGVEEVSDKEFYSRLESGEYSIALYPATADYNSGISFLKKLEQCPYINLTAQCSQAINQLDCIGNSSEYVERFSSIEKQILDENCFIPIFYKNTYLVIKKENEDVVYDAFSGAVNYQNAKHYN
ncbi:MAG: peptide ABC transporter substrate-binding protein [Ruminococcus sp.]|nr:peptide ABC transporter substrate-binding protein [Ruminococcus sp.]